MIDFFFHLKSRNEVLFYYGIICFLAALVFLVLSQTTSTQVFNVNAWFKPFKFAFSTFTFVWAMGWYCAYLPNFNVPMFNWTVIILLSFEIIYIAVMASQGLKSHYNMSSTFFSLMYTLMALAASLVTIYTAYVGWRFWTESFPELESHYLWAIRLGILIFVIFSFQGFLMGSRLNHSVGLDNDNSNIFILGWSKLVGDLRIAHFVGMHALQVLPFLAFYAFRNSTLTVLFSVFYFTLASFTLIQALQGKPLIKAKETTIETTK